MESAYFGLAPFFPPWPGFALRRVHGGYMTDLLMVAGHYEKDHKEHH